MISKEAKDKLDLRLVNGEISKEQYDEILSTIWGAPTASATGVPEAGLFAQAPTSQSSLGEPPDRARELGPSGDSASGGASAAKWTYLLLAGGGFALYVAAIVLRVNYDYSLADTLVDFSLISYALAGIAFWANVYVGWKAIQGKTARTTPGKAVGLLLVPVFNFYWMFNVLPGLAMDIRKSEGKSHVSFGLAVLGYAAIVGSMAAHMFGVRLRDLFFIMIVVFAILTPLVFQISKYASKR